MALYTYEQIADAIKTVEKDATMASLYMLKLQREGLDKDAPAKELPADLSARLPHGAVEILRGLHKQNPAPQEPRDRSLLTVFIADFTSREPSADASFPNPKIEEGESFHPDHLKEVVSEQHKVARPGTHEFYIVATQDKHGKKIAEGPVVYPTAGVFRCSLCRTPSKTSFGCGICSNVCCRLCCAPAPLGMQTGSGAFSALHNNQRSHICIKCFTAKPVAPPSLPVLPHALGLPNGETREDMERQLRASVERLGILPSLPADVTPVLKEMGLASPTPVQKDAGVKRKPLEEIPSASSKKSRAEEDRPRR